MTATSRQPLQEQSYVSMLYGRLDTLRVLTRSRLSSVRRAGPSGSPQNRSERDAFAALYEDRLTQLESVEDRLCFGRLDLDDESSRYIGRIGLSDDAHEQLLTDWRAPAAEPFYQATPAHRLGVIRRRHILTSQRKVVDVEDDVLDVDALSDADRAGLAGEGALMAALSAHRTGRMSDIVPTIQAEQDAAIRSPLNGILVVQGGPGTGKTAVALHRAAYLLYAHRNRLERSGVLLVGPNRRFLRYIDQVLPSLGETGAVTTSIGDLLPGISVDAKDRPNVAELKGQSKMAAIISRAITNRQRIPDEDVTIVFDGEELTLTRKMFAAARDRARRTHRPHNEARVNFVRTMLAELADQAAGNLGMTIDAAERTEILNDLRRMREVRIALNLAWMPLSSQKVIEDLFADPARLAAAAPELSDAERELLARPRGSTWTVSDIPLLDEAAELLGNDQQAALHRAQVEAERHAAELAFAQDVLESSRNTIVRAEELAARFTPTGPRLTTAERAMQDRSWTYGHIVVDEAQELSAMDWRSLLRRCPTRSMTVVGDIAQTTTGGGARSWQSLFDPMVSRAHWRTSELSINYRTPDHVMDTASRVVRRAGLEVRVPRSVRTVERAVVVDEVSTDLVAATVAACADELRRVGPGTIAIIATGAVVAELRAAMVSDQSLRDAVSEDRVSILTANQAKGLEFDAVVLAEPMDILEDFSGVSQLYVAMTRPTNTLRVVHAKPLPPGFESQ